MNRVAYGTTLPQFSGDPRALVDAARRAERAGFDSIWLFDHLWPLTGGKQRPIAECWTALAYLAEATENVTLGTLVTRSSLRVPLVLGHMAATVARIAPGRLVVAIGSGDHKSRGENEAFGIPYWAGAERLAQLEETVRVVRDALEGRAVVWVGGRSDAAIDVAARLADGWNGWGGSVERFAQDVSSLAEYAAGRPVEPSWGGIVSVAGEAKPSHSASGAPGIAALARALVDAGARQLVLGLPDPGVPGRIEALAEVVAGLR